MTQAPDELCSERDPAIFEATEKPVRRSPLSRSSHSDGL